MIKEQLFGKTLTELTEIVKIKKLPSFTAKQIADWLYKKDIRTIDEMSNLSKKAREILNKSYEVGLNEPVSVQTSSDGTKKYLFKTGKNYIEAAYIPSDDKATLCVSSQAGCKYACEFCMTGRQGFQAHLSANEILNQIKSLPEFKTLTNVVYMGMGEPFDNLDNVLKSNEILTADWGFAWSPKRITVSTNGIISGLKRFLSESKCHLAISIHTPFDDERLRIMPVQKTNPIKDVIKIVKNHEFGRQRRISFEYIVFKGFNDSIKHADELARLVYGFHARVNLIRFHEISGTDLKGADEKTMVNFRDRLNEKGITATVRASRGQDIDAACGLLSTKEQKGKS
ncbi:MAG: 23S rRNA (adenine(2503)-C(2))-methyltransferase RlmN [Bacteroidetes bacterium]|nr:MAG: 23S rRNA (adenine(2503)-C(2))-methyltransferase RlmN [Bacteroidota bacterium]